MTKDVFKFLNEFKSDIDIAEEIFNDENAINESIDDFLFEETIDELIEEAALTISEDIADDMIIEAFPNKTSTSTFTIAAVYSF